MIFKSFLGYIEGQDVATIPINYLAAPSKDVFIYKGIAYSRPGIVNDGTAPTGSHKIIGEHVFPSLSGEQPIRVTQDGRMQIKYAGKWITIYSGFAPTAARVRFAEWTDDNNTIIKKRIFGVDGRDKIFQWAGAIGVIRAASNAAGMIAKILTNPNDDATHFNQNSSGGAGYVVGDVLTVSGGGGNAKLLVNTVTPGGIKTAALVNAGTGYSPGSIVTVQTPSSGVAAILTVLTVDGSGVILTFSILHSGSGYAASTTYTTTGGTAGTHATITTSTIGDCITSLTILKQGTGYSVAAAVATTGGTGTGASMQIQNLASNQLIMEAVNTLGNVTSVIVANGGAGYAVNDVLTAQMAGTVAAILTVVAVSAGVITAFTITEPGNGYSYGDTLTLTGGGGSGATATVLSTGKSIEQLGFDYPSNISGEATTVRVIHFSGGVVASYEEHTVAYEVGDTFNFNADFSSVPSDGDVVVSAVTEHSDILTGILKDDIYNYQNHLAVANLAEVRVYFSDAEGYLDYTEPAAVDRTALSAFHVDLPSPYTAMIARLNQNTGLSTLWVSTMSSWTRVTALLTPDTNHAWIQIQLFDDSRQLGALPLAVTQYKGDAIFLAQDKTLQQITTVAQTGTDVKDIFQLLSDEVEGLLNRIDTSEVRLYYTKRYVYIVCPVGSTTVILDKVVNHWQPPQTLPMSHMSWIDGVLYGHSNSYDETFKLFSGRSDLGKPITSVFAGAYYEGFQLHRGKTIPQDFQLKDFTRMGVSCRMTKTSVAKVEEFFENDGSKAKETFLIDGSKVTMYSAADVQTWASHIFGDASVGGADDDVNEQLGRVYAWSHYDALSWFEFRPIITVTPITGSVEQEFHLIGWYINDELSEDNIPEDLFIERATP